MAGCLDGPIPMKLYGVDFTSTPGPSKPITVARCELAGDRLDRLVVRDLLRISDFPRFERALCEPGPWIAGFDFPFGLPRKLLHRLGWSENWEAVVGRVAALSRQEWVDLLTLYRAARPRGDKEHRRATDVAAGSLSPMKTHGVPLAKMFQEGASRLAAAPVAILPCRPPSPEDTGPGMERIAVEAYPGVAARTLIGRRSYKSEDRRKRDGARSGARRELARCLGSDELRTSHGLTVEMTRFQVSLLHNDATGDLLDAVLCAVQAAWAWKRRDRGFGLPSDADPVEGWIADPATCPG